MMTQLNFKRNIPLRYEVEVFVAGGGPAGIAAALAAAGQNRTVFLAEAQNCLGGMGTAGLVPAFMQFSDGVRFLAEGVGRKIYERLKKAGGTGPDDELAIRAEVLKRVYDQLISENDNIILSLCTHLIAVETQDEQVQYAVCHAKSGLFAVRADIFIDGTGDGDLAAWAGAPYEKGDSQAVMMPGTLCSLWANLQWETIKRPGYLYDARFLDQAFKQKIFTVEDRHLSGLWRTGATTGGGNIGHVFGVDGTDERSVTKALIAARRALAEYARYYQTFIRGCEAMELVATGSLLGIRESRRIRGDYVLNLEDFRNRARFADEIGRYCYHVDIHPADSKPVEFERFQKQFRNLRYEKGESYGVPYRILVPHNLSNVLVAGRCVSTDRYLQSSIRTMPGCYITGQAAGIAAALAVEKSINTRQVNITELQARLKA